VIRRILGGALGALLERAFVLVRCVITLSYWPASALRGRPLSAALSSPAPAARVQWRGSTACGCRSAPTHTRPQARVRMGAWSVDTGRSQRGVQSVMSGATAAATDEACCAEQCDGAGGWDAIGYQIGHGESAARVAIVPSKHKVQI